MAKLPSISGLPAPAKGSKIYYGFGLPGFGVRVTANNVRAFILNYRASGGKERRLTIGSCDVWSLGQAEERAKELRRAIDAGKDPAGEAETARQAPSMLALVERYRREILPARRGSTRAEYERLIDREILPSLGGSKVAAITEADCERLHRKITAPYVANRAIALLSAMFAHAVRWKMRPDNPCRGLTKNKEHKRERFLTGPELDRLLVAIDDSPDKQAGQVFRLLLLCGARIGEVLSMRWQALDLEAGIWNKRHEDTKQERAHRCPLSGEALDLLREIRDAGRPGAFVFPGRGGAGCRADINRPWRQVRKAAGLENFRLHDLRHSYASFCANSGLSLQVIGSLLGHSDVATTQRYSHLFDSTLRETTQRVGTIISNAKPRLKVINR